jgi:Kef-type K+ transport system membrane component KefB
MRQVWIYSSLLVLGLVASQALGTSDSAAHPALATAVRLLTMAALAFIMIHVGYEFDVDKSRIRSYGWDYLVAGTAAAFPWLFCCFYFVFVLLPREAWTDPQAWKESLLAARFAAPTSAGVLFSMLAAAGLSATWVFRKARVLAIFDDLDTVLLMIPLKMLMVGVRWHLAVVVGVMAVLLGLAWRFLHALRLPVTWPFVLVYSIAITALCEGIHVSSQMIDETVSIHIEVLLPAFVLGCMLARPPRKDPHADDARAGHQEGPEDPGEQRISRLVSAVFMVLVGLSMPPLAQAGGGQALPMGVLALHVLLLTVISNLGKCFSMLCYRKEASLRERIAVSIAMFPRGEVGAGILVVSIGYGIAGPMVSVAMLSLAANLLLTGVFIAIVKRLVAARPGAATTA